MSKKSKLAFWLVSRCQTDSKRMKFTQELQNFIQIDIYGKCGSLNSSQPDFNSRFESLAPKYKFYLAFEISNCYQFVTGKYWKTLGRPV